MLAIKPKVQRMRLAPIFRSCCIIVVGDSKIPVPENLWVMMAAEASWVIGRWHTHHPIYYDTSDLESTQQIFVLWRLCKFFRRVTDSFLLVQVYQIINTEATKTDIAPVLMQTLWGYRHGWWLVLRRIPLHGFDQFRVLISGEARFICRWIAIGYIEMLSTSNMKEGLAEPWRLWSIWARPRPHP